MYIFNVISFTLPPDEIIGKTVSKHLKISEFSLVKSFKMLFGL